MTLRRDGGSDLLRHRGYEASISFGHDEFITGYIRDIHEYIQIRGQTVAELRSDFASKIEAYEARCTAQGLAPFNTPDGRSTADIVDEEQAAYHAAIEEEASQWPPFDESFFEAKAKLMEQHAKTVEQITYIRVPDNLRLPIDEIIDELRSRQRPPHIAVFRTDVVNQRRLNWYARIRIAVAFRAASRSDLRRLEVKQADTIDFITEAQNLQVTALDDGFRLA